MFSDYIGIGKRLDSYITPFNYGITTMSTKPPRSLRSTGETIVCEKCCAGDICNAGSLCHTVDVLYSEYECCWIWLQCMENWLSTQRVGSKCVDKSPTCTNSAFQVFACPDKELQKSCMKSCGLCNRDPNPCVHGTCISSLQGYSCSCHHGYTGSICDKPIDRTGIVIDNFDVSPKPIEIPGNISVTLNSRIARRLPADHHYRLNVTIDKNLLGHWHVVPCTKNVGTW
ncbi:NOTCH1 [Mytilus edulis]|uniref:NOTCH1 n=1 Tax=Mytilus edulis TaxID=6550 RepID=A0A8S3S4N3_MYTED|nr:NOTCH1 [Mytilus edulis]